MKLIKFLIATLLLISAIAHSAAPQLIDIEVNGPKDKRINILFLGDGYTAGQKDLFLADVAVFKAALMDSPWGSYTNYFNSYALFAESQQSGATYEDGVTVKNTAYECSYWVANIERLLACNSALTFAAKNEYLPETDMVMVVVNSNLYGGSGGSISVANRTSPEIVAHEMGHTFVHLADEYDYPGAASAEAPNATMNIARDTLTWRHWVESSTPLATPETQEYADVVGAFEGAAYQPVGWYRPTLTSRMQVNGAPLGPVNSEQFVLSMYDAISPIDAVQPAEGTVIWQPGSNLAVTPLLPDNANLAIEWSVNGVITTETGTIFTGSNLPLNGTATVTAKVIDKTALVRKDPNGLLFDTASWVVQTRGSSSSRSSFNSSSRPSSASASNSSSSAVVPTQCNWWGQIVPLCVNVSSGWGYENNASCVAVSTCNSQPYPYGVIGGASSSAANSSLLSSRSSSSSNSVRSSIAPIFVEAENYDTMRGVQTQPTSDTGGGLNVGWMDAGDWISYAGAKSINIPATGTYKVEFRVASQNGGGSFTFQKTGGNPIYASVKVPTTGAWQNWTTVTSTINLTAGLQGFGIAVKTGGFNLNWYRITKL
ncbi:MAG: M64 family metallopeptidase [Pseudomonadota bacterium]